METLKRTLANLAHAPGIYIFYDGASTVLYIGKARDISRRVSHYFSNDAKDAKTKQLIPRIARIETKPTLTEFDALLLEAQLIREFKPKYNSIAKDDKSPLYIVITTSEHLPHVFFLRSRDLPLRVTSKDCVFGPFQSGRVARELLRDLRRIIPYCTQQKRTGRPCFYTHLGFCNPCPSKIVSLPKGDPRAKYEREYRHNIFSLKYILSGRTNRVLKHMEQSVHRHAQRLEFEDALIIKRQIAELLSLYGRHYDVSLFATNSGLTRTATQELDNLRAVLTPYYPEITKLQRIECIDISNTSGSEATGSLVVLTDGLVDFHGYRRFRIRNTHTPNDVAMIAEVMKRRFSHDEWPSPDLLVIDGGKTQVARASFVLANIGKTTPVIGLAKRYEEIVIKKDNSFQIVRLPLTNPALHILERIRDEAHRFAHSYHRVLRAKKFLSS